MRAAVYYENGGPEVFRYEEVSDPQPGPGDVLVQVNFTNGGVIQDFNGIVRYEGSVYFDGAFLGQIAHRDAANGDSRTDLTLNGGAVLFEECDGS